LISELLVDFLTAANRQWLLKLLAYDDFFLKYDVYTLEKRMELLEITVVKKKKV
jgi:hypothetical protein